MLFNKKTYIILISAVLISWLLSYAFRFTVANPLYDNGLSTYAFMP